MKKIIRAVNELKVVLIKIKMYESLADTLLIFLFAYLVCMLFYIPWWVSIFPTFAFMLYNTRKKFDAVKFKRVENIVPELRYQLTTAADNLFKENEIVDGLQNDVIDNMKKVKVSYFVPFKKIWREMVVIGFLCFVIILISSLNVKLVDYKIVMDELKDIGDVGSDYDFDMDPLTAGGAENDDIFGNESIAELGQEELNLQINPVLSEINIEDIKDVEEKDFKDTMFPDEIVASTDSSFDEDIPKENKEIVKRYFSSIALGN